jgi:Arc/MetJ-type ribon-helix-helix transcriptional regulator
MKSVQVELPDKVAAKLDTLVQEGWFQSEGEVLRVALVEFIKRHRFELIEQFQLEDIDWALQQKAMKK